VSTIFKTRFASNIISDANF